MADPIFRNDDETRWGTGKGSNLTPTEVDLNFWALLERIFALETGGAIPNGIANIFATGTVLTIVLDDATEYNVDMPVLTFNPRGAYEPLADYLPLDVIRAPGFGVYLVLRIHTGADPFDPDALSDPGGDPLYMLLIAEPSLMGSLKDVITISAINHTAELSDAGVLIRCTNINGCVITIPEQAEVAWAKGTILRFRAEQSLDLSNEVYVQVVGEVGVNVNPPEGFEDFTAGKWAIIEAINLDEDEWALEGRLAAI